MSSAKNTAGHAAGTDSGTLVPLQSHALTRRDAFKAAFAAAGGLALLGLPETALAASASKETTDALNSAQAQLDKVQSQLDSISNEYQSLADELNSTMDQIESVQNEIDGTQEQIDKKQAELEEKQETLSARVTQSYKNGNTDILALLLSSSSFDELISNVYYIDKVNARDQEAIAEVQQIKQELADKKAELEKQKESLESLKDEQTTKLNEMSAKKDEVQSILDGLSSDVKSLMEKRDAELLASAQEEERARKQAEAAKKAASSSSSSSSSSGSAGKGGGGSGSASNVVYWAQHTASPGAGLCAWWVADVFINAGLGNVSGNACDMYANYCYSSDRSALKPGMIIAVSSHPYTTAGKIYGHVGIYIGNNTVMDNIGYIRTCSADYWISYYGASVTVRWGWAKGIVLS